jgi:hypothetical protein
VAGRGDVAGGLVGADPGRDEQHAIQAEAAPGGERDAEVPSMDGVEGAAEDSDPVWNS